MWQPLITDFSMPTSGWAYSNLIPSQARFFKVINRLFNPPDQIWGTIAQIEPGERPLIFQQQRWRLRLEGQIFELSSTPFFSDRRVGIQIASVAEYHPDFECIVNVEFWENDIDEIKPNIPYQVETTSSSRVIAHCNPRRKEIKLLNTGTVNIFIGLNDNVSLATGIPVSPGKAYIRGKEDWMYRGSISAVSSSNSLMTIFEYE